MTRNLTAGFQTETLASALRPVLFFEIAHSGGTSRAWTGYGSIVWNGQTWTGVGHFLSVAPIEEASDVVANGVAITLSGVPQSLLSLALSQVRQGKPVKLWLGALDANGAVIADPYLTFSGRFDTCIVNEGAETATISIQAENRLIDLERARVRRYTHEDQQIDFPGDKGLEYLASIQDKPIVWGQKSPPAGQPIA
jgi:hypothetical protein